MSEELFRITDADAGYRKNCFIKNLSFSVIKGDFISLIGPNGAGKSTIIKLLSGILSPFGGKVEFMDRDIRSIGNRELAKSFSVVSQISGELPDFTVKNFISLGRFPFFDILDGNDADNSYIEMASRTGVTRLLDRSIRELSAGEFQLVQVTRALVQNKNILLLDEPVSNLDYRHIVMIMDILKKLHHEGTTIICALHDVNAAMDYCSRVVAIKDGAVFFDGEPDVVINQNSMSGLYETEFYCGISPVTGRPLLLPVPGSFR
jgi:iron complex transport system ATP-binding protein